MRSNRIVPVALGVLGVLLIAAAAILAWVIVPGRTELPADTNTVRDFSGTARVLLDPRAVAAGDLRNALLVDAPVTAQRTVKVLATDGDAAQVSDRRTVAVQGGQQVGGTDVTYAVDRKTLEGASGFPDSWDAVQPNGLTVSWAIGAEQKDYPVWVNETQTSATAKFVRTEEKNGVDTYVYEVATATAPIKDQQVLGSLPTNLPGTTIAALASRLPLPDDQKALLAQALPTLGAQVPLSYTYESTSTVWVEPTTGLVVDTERRETRKAGIGSVGAVPIYDVSTSFTDQSVQAAADDATDKKDDINRLGTTWPWIIAIVGIVLLVIALLLFFLGRRRVRPSPPA